MSHSAPPAEAVLRVKSALFTAALVSAEGLHVTIPFHDTLPPTFALGDPVSIRLSGLPASYSGPARVIQRLEQDAGRRYVILLDAPLPPLAELQPPPHRERRHTRLTPPGTIAAVSLKPVSRSGRVRNKLEHQGRLVDVSSGGLGVVLDTRREGALTGHERVLAAFTPPSGTSQVTRECRIRGRHLTERGIRLGLQFVEVDETLVFEPRWSCTCGENSLFAGSHPHCPACGVPRSGPLELIHWETARPLSEHRFTGNTHVCGACGAHWAAAAHYCGTCGNSLLHRDPSLKTTQPDEETAHP